MKMDKEGVDSKECIFQEENKDYRAAGSDITLLEALSFPMCCAFCDQNPQCKFVTFAPGSRMCYLKRTMGMEVDAEGLISGGV